MYLFVWKSKLELPCTGSLPAGDTGQEQPGHKLVLTWDASIINSGSVHHTMLTPHLWAWEHLTFPRQMFFGVWRPVPMLAYVKDSLKVHIIIGSLLLPLTFSYSDSVGCDKETIEWCKCHQAIPEEREVVSESKVTRSCCLLIGIGLCGHLPVSSLLTPILWHSSGNVNGLGRRWRVASSPWTTIFTLFKSMSCVFIWKTNTHTQVHT